MISVTSIVIVSCALALGVQAQNACTNVDTGDDLTETPVPLKPVELAPQVADWTVTVPDVPQCTDGVAHVSANICDDDLPPEGNFTDIKTLLVHRTGNLEGVGLVYITVYCN